MIYEGIGAQEIYQSLVKMSWNHNCVYQSGLGQAIWYFRAKARRDSPLLARSGPSLSGSLSPTNTCSRIWRQKAASLSSKTLLYPFSCVSK